MNTFPLAVDASQVTPGVLGFIVVALLGVALYLLIRSMNKQITRIDFDDKAKRGRRDAAERRDPGDAGATADPARAAGASDQPPPDDERRG